MKLVELLARELDVWPEQAECATQEGGGCAYFWKSYRLSYVRGDWVHGSGYGLISEDWSHSLSELAVDHTTAIITRADWQAERERIAGGWIAWGGGECPVAEGVRVDVRYRCAKEDMNSGALETIGCQSQNWLDENHRYDIIAYRLHKPEQASAEAIDAGIAAADAGQVKPIAEAKARYDHQPQQEQEEMTPCEKLGYKVGDRFKMIDPTHGGYVGQIAELYYDDGTHEPKFLRPARALLTAATASLALITRLIGSLKSTNPGRPQPSTPTTPAPCATASSKSTAPPKRLRKSAWRWCSGWLVRGLVCCRLWRTVSRKNGRLET